MKKEKEVTQKGFHIFKTAAISGILIVALFILGIIVSSLIKNNLALSSAWSIVQSILVNLLFIVFILGFYALGKKYNSRFLKVMCILIIIFTILSFFGSIFIISPLVSQASQMAAQKAVSLGLDLKTITDEQAQLFAKELFQDTQFLGVVGTIFIFLLIYLIIAAILIIFSGISLIKLKEKIVYSKPTGILMITGAVTMIIIIGLFVLLAAFIMQLIILFKESKK